VEHILRDINVKHGRQVRGVNPEVIEMFASYSWPGNVRELQNAMEYAVVLARQDLVGVKELPAEVRLPTVLQRTERAAAAQQGVQSLDDVERATILQALAQCHGNKKKAAQLLGIQRPTLYNKMKRYAIEL
jgi:DNA-binding NtrC family response regulator